MPFKCKGCGYNFQSATALFNHLKRYPAHKRSNSGSRGFRGRSRSNYRRRY